MSDALEKVLGIRHLPIFPLPLVLLPGEILPLHIFEPRYSQMLQDVALERNIFGISFFDPQESFAEKPAVGSVGCVTEVKDVQAISDQRSNIITAGLIRYRLLNFVDLDKPYLTAEVEFFEDVGEDEDSLQRLADETFHLFERIAKAAFDLSGNRGKFPEIQQAEPEQLSFFVTAAFNLENELKYQLLEMNSTTERLLRLRGILEQAVSRMEENSGIHKAAQTNGHSKKNIEF